MKYSYRYLKKEVKNILVKKHNDLRRYNHVLNVVKLAVSLSKKYNASLYNARISALLHDITKDEKLSFHRFYVSSQDYELYKDTPGILHSFSGASYVKQHFHIKNKIIINAIRVHTIGSIDHNITSMILYISDCSEEGRSYSEAKTIRDTALNVGLDEACLLSIKLKLSYLIKNGKQPASNTIKALEYFENKIANKT